VTGISSLADIALAVQRGATVTISNGFHARNTAIANNSDAAIAFGFGDAPVGGTADAWKKLERAGAKRTYVAIDALLGEAPDASA
jgi:hypothetical protein